jgi:hypothetical protein
MIVNEGLSSPNQMQIVPDCSLSTATEIESGLTHTHRSSFTWNRLILSRRNMQIPVNEDGRPVWPP